ncbi:hypothetical protein OG21DRAFT_1513952 [Imleria badia]|nr:hypothetical protein OG21DRAFT_1513952 [Imleria badia]
MAAIPHTSTSSNVSLHHLTDTSESDPTVRLDDQHTRTVQWNGERHGGPKYTSSAVGVIMIDTVELILRYAAKGHYTLLPYGVRFLCAVGNLVVSMAISCGLTLLSTAV